jgi:16S rRNA (guanine966-N2)-methyltransferase
MRIVAGAFRGRELAAPRSDRIRPTSDRLRETMFNILAHAYDDPVAEARVIDLFAGTGALGLEALSRGARHALFVDDGAEARGLIRANIEALGLAGRARVLEADAVAALRGPGEYDLVFLDPPYAAAGSLEGPLARGLPGLLAAGARVVSESDRRAPFELGLPLTRERRYGDTMIRIHHTEPT